MNLEINRCLDLRYRTKANTYPVCIRLYYNRKYDYLKTGVYLSEQEYSELHNPKAKSAFKEVLKKIVDIETSVHEYIKGSNVYDVKLIRSYIEKKDQVILSPSKKNSLSVNVFDWFEIKIGLLKKNKQFGSAESYTSTKNVYIDSLQATSLPFQFFTVEKMKELEVLMMDKRQIEISTIGKHARNLRAIFKMALNEGVINGAEYPFGRYKYIIPEVTKAKKSLSRQMLASLMCYHPVSYFEERAVGFFIFSYYGNGMNLKDIALLKYKDWKDDILCFTRKKTKNTTIKQKLIRVIVTDEMKSIINQFGNIDKRPDSYIFTIVEAGMNEERINTRVQTRNKSINNTLKRISKKLSFDKHITLGMSRHTFANALKQEGASIAFIQESLGHTSADTTEHYLSSFEDAISAEHITKLKKYFEQPKNKDVIQKELK